MNKFGDQQGLPRLGQAVCGFLLLDGRVVGAGFVAEMAGQHFGVKADDGGNNFAEPKAHGTWVRLVCSRLEI